MTVYNHIAMSIHCIQCIVVYCTYNTLDCIDSGQQRWFNSMGKSKFKYFFEKKTTYNYEIPRWCHLQSLLSPEQF